jgi:4-hydroxy-tetrahydrodipicolinate reductase
MFSPIYLVINGASGRMGHALIQACVANKETELSAGLVRSTSTLVGSDAGQVAGVGSLGVLLRSELTDSPAHAWIDFTLPDGAMSGLEECLARELPMVIGTTGFSKVQKQKIYQAGRKIPIVYAPNMSIGVNLCLNLLHTAAETLNDDYDIEIIEAHHRNKVDAPSGTALRMGEVIAEATKTKLEDRATYVREGNIGVRKKGEIGFETIRAGDIVGEHTVYFAGIGERIEITHRATSRMTFAQGAVRAAIWLQNQPPGVYDMQDVLGLT